MLYEVITGLDRAQNVVGLEHSSDVLGRHGRGIIKIVHAAEDQRGSAEQGLAVTAGEVEGVVVGGHDHRITSYNVCYTKLLRNRYRSDDYT